MISTNTILVFWSHFLTNLLYNIDILIRESIEQGSRAYDLSNDDGDIVKLSTCKKNEFFSLAM